MGLSDVGLAPLFVEALTDYAIVLVDRAGTIVTWNAGARTLLGYAADETVGETFSALFSRMDPAASGSIASVYDAVHWGRHETNRALVRRDGTRVQANIVMRPIADESGEAVGFGVIMHDIDRSRRIAAAVPAAPAAAAAPAGGARILVVDDNQGVLGIAVDQLTSLGYRTVSASSGDEAMEILRQDDQIDLLFTDVVMPGELAGRALAPRRWRCAPASRCCSRPAISRARWSARASSSAMCSSCPSRTASRSWRRKSRKC
jgi:PAS domain S-box-containing protein